MIDPDTQNIREIAVFTDGIYFTFFTILAVSVILIVKFRVEFVMWITLGIYQTAFFIGLLELILYESVYNEQFIEEYLPGAKVASRYAIWLAHAYFVFAMKDVYNKLQCETHTEYLSKRKRDKILEWTTYTLAIGIGLFSGIFFFV